MKQLGFRFKVFALALLLSCVVTPLTRAEIVISPEEMQEICLAEVTYASLHKNVGGDIIDAFKTIQNITPEDVWSSEFKTVVDRVAAGYTTVPQDVVERALVWACQVLENEHGKIENVQDVTRVADAFAGYYEKLAQGNVSIKRSGDDEERAPRPSNTILVDDGSHDPMQEVPLPRDLNIERNGNFGGNLFVDGNLVVEGSISSTGGLVFNSDIILEPLVGNDICIIYKQSDGFEKARMCSSSVFDDKGLSISVDGGATQNFRVQNDGNVTIAAPLGLVPAFAVTPALNTDGIVIGDAGTAFEIDMVGVTPAINGASLQLATGGTTRVTIDASGNVIQAGGQYLAADGSALNPAYSFDSDSAMGMYKSASDLDLIASANMEFSAGGYPAQRFLFQNGQIQAAGNSAASAPMYSFSNATDAGMHNDTGSNLYFATSGIDRLTINSSGNASFSGNVAIDTGLLTADRAHIGGVSDPGSNNLQVDGQILAADGTLLAPSISFASNPGEGIFLSGTDVGLTSTANMNFNAGGYPASRFLFQNGQIQAAGNASASAPMYSFSNAADAGMHNDAGSNLYFATSGVDRLTIDSSGNVSFTGNVAIDTGLLTADRAHIGGVSDPGSNNLQVDGQILAANGTVLAPGVSFSADTAAGMFQSAGDLGLVGANIDFNAGGYPAQRFLFQNGQIQAAGNASASAPMYSFSNATDAGMHNDTGSNLYFATSGVDRLTINSSGNVSFTGNVAIDTGLLTADRAHIGGVSDPGSNNLQVDGQIQAADGVLLAPSISFANNTSMGLFRSAGDLGVTSTQGMFFTGGGYPANKFSFYNGQIQGAGETLASAPMYSFISAGDTGMRNNLTNLYLVTAGVDRLTLNSSGNASFSGNVAVDTGLLTADRAHIGGVSDPGSNNLLVDGTAQVDGQILAADGTLLAPGISFSANSAVGLYQSAGNLNTTSTADTNFSAGGYLTNSFVFQNGQIHAAGNSLATRPMYSFSNATNTGMRNDTGANLYLVTNGVDRLSIDSSGNFTLAGNVQVNGSETLTSPASGTDVFVRLEGIGAALNSGVPSLQFKRTRNATGFVAGDILADITALGNDPLSSGFQFGGRLEFAVTGASSAGHVPTQFTIATDNGTAFANRLIVDGSGNTQVTGQLLAANGTSGAPGVSFSANSAVGMYQSAGTLGITAPQDIQITAGGYPTHFVEISSGQLRVAGNSTAAAPEYSFTNATNSGLRNDGSGNIFFVTSGTDRVEIASTGDVTVNAGLTVNNNATFQSSAVGTDENVYIVGNGNGFDAGVPNAFFIRNNSVNLANGDTLARINFNASAANTGGEIVAGYIRATTVVGSGLGNVPTKLGFATCDGTGTLTEGFQIQTNGRVFTPNLLANIPGGTALFVVTGSGGELTYSTSSERYKKDIVDLSYTNDVFDKLRPVSFVYKNDVTNTRTIGFIAEEVAQLYPEIISYITKRQAGIADSDELIPESLRYDLLPVILVDQVKKMKLIEQAQQAEIAMLTNKLDEVMARLAKLEQ